MKKNLLTLILAVLNIWVISQTTDGKSKPYFNIADNLLTGNSKLMIGGYGEVHYNQPFSGDTRYNGKLDVHRMVMLFGYNFTEKIQFVTELEFEHVTEVYVEQAFLQYKLNNYLNLRAGLLLVPMGIINEYHEPTTFNGVERPLIDTYISPTTWREIGFGISGNILNASIKYQAYCMNGFNGYDGSSNLSGKDGLRKGRQKGAESIISAPNFSGKIEYFGIRGLNVGLSGYLGKTQTTLYHGVDRDDAAAIAKADSSVVGVAMVGIDTRYNLKGLRLRGQFYYTNLSNTQQYNEFTADDYGKLNDLGSAMLGYYAEAGYNVLRSVKTEKQLIPFIRYEFLNTHFDVENNITQNSNYDKHSISAGLTLFLTKGAVAKADMQFEKTSSADKYSKVLNIGFGVMF